MGYAEEFNGLMKSINGANRLNYFKTELLKVLDAAEKKENTLSKAIQEYFEDIHKSLYGIGIEKGRVGTIGEIRTWKDGKKYKKMPNGNWVRVYQSQNRSAEISIARLKGKVRNAQTVDELMNIVMANVHRFEDENGQILPIVEELKKEVDAGKGRINAGKPSTKEQIEKFKAEKKAKEEAEKLKTEKKKQKKEKSTNGLKFDNLHPEMAKGKWKKEFNLLAEFVNNQVDADPNAVRLLSKLNGLKMDVPFKMKTIPKKSRQLSNGGFVMSVDRFTYECVKCELVIDQGMDGEHKLSNACRDIHEIGHILDYINRKDKKVCHEYTGSDKELIHIIMNSTVPDDVIKHISSVNQEFQNLQQPILKQMDEINKKVSTINSQYTNGEIGRSEYDIIYDDYVKSFNNKKNELLRVNERFFPQRQLSDIFDAISGGRIFDEGIGAGHGGKYYRDVTDRAKEIFANYFSLSIVGKKEIDYLRSVYPNLCDKMDSIIKMMGE